MNSGADLQEFRMRHGTARAAVIGVFLLAAALRWAQPGIVEFKYDEAHTVSLAFDVARGKDFPLTSGGTSIGIERPALDAYLLAIPLALGRIELGVWWTGALGVLAVALTYGLGRQVYGGRVGLLAALYMAANPWLVLYDRKLWSHIQVVLSAGLLWLAWEVVICGRRRASFWFFIVATLQCLSHTLALLQVFSWLSTLAIAPRRWVNRAWLAGAAVSALLLAPYAVGLVSKLSADRDIIASSTSYPSILTTFGLVPGRGLAQALSLFGGRDINVLAGSPTEALGVAARWLAWPVTALMVVGFVVILRASRPRGVDAAAARLLLAWTVLPLVILSFALEVYHQYWTVLLPLPALYFGIGASKLAGRLPVSVRYIGGGFVLAVLVTVWVGSYANVIKAVEQGKGGAVFGIPLQRWEEAAQAAIIQAKQADAAGIRAAVRGTDPRYADEPAVIAAVLRTEKDVRLVAPGWPYFALVDSRYESDGNVIATEALRRQGPPPRDVTPGYSLLDVARPTVFLWAAEEPGIEEVMARIGNLTWEGQLTESRSPIRIYVLPSRTEILHRAANTVELLAGGVQDNLASVVLNEPDCPLSDALAALPIVLLPPQANDAPAALAEAKRLMQTGVRRVVFVAQNSGWWDDNAAAETALQATYRKVAEWPIQLWRAQVYVLPPLSLTNKAANFAGGLMLRAFAFESDDLAPGSPLVAHLAWSANTPQPANLKISLQVLAQGGAVAAQVDRDLEEVDLAASVTSYAVLLPPDMLVGRYRVIAVVYDALTGRRLETLTGDFVDLGTIELFSATESAPFAVNVQVR